MAWQLHIFSPVLPVPAQRIREGHREQVVDYSCRQTVGCPNLGGTAHERAMTAVLSLSSVAFVQVALWLAQQLAPTLAMRRSQL